MSRPTEEARNLTVLSNNWWLIRQADTAKTTT